MIYFMLALVLFLLGVIIGMFLRVLWQMREGKQGDQVQRDQVQRDQVQRDQVQLTEFELAIVQCSKGGTVKAERLVMALREVGILTNRETVRKTVNSLREKGYYV